MSQVRFRTTFQDKEESRAHRAVVVVAGYDRPLDYYHLTIFDILDEDADPLWSNLDHFDFNELRTTVPLRKVLDDLKIQTPPNFWETVELNEGNVFHRLPSTGALTEKN